MWPFRREPHRASGLEPATTGAPRIGEVLDGKYRVERVLGVGGMGVVVAARHLKLGETVAIKVLLQGKNRGKDDAHRFLREGRAASRLRSEHVVRILDMGEEPGGAPFLVMEHLVGRDLAAVLAQDGPLDLDDALDFMLDACESIAEAHAVGVVHRDLKPANLFLSRRADGTACLKVLDFGISKLAEGEDLSLTQTRTLMGSPVYMAPEIMRSARAAGPSSDIWSLGIILYELLTGLVPFQADTITELTIKVLEQQPRALRMVRQDVSVELEAVVMRCLAKDPEQRFANVEELARALATCAGVPALARLERLRRVVRDAEARGQRQAATADLPDALGPRAALAPAEGATTIRGVTTAQPFTASRGRTAWVLAGGTVVLVGGVAAIAALSGTTSPAGAPSASGSLDQASTQLPLLPAPAASSTAPAASLSASAKPSAKPSVKAAPPKGPAKPGKPAVGSPYFDDPN